MVVFSIVIPCYNLERFIGKSIESVRNQTFQDFEIIIVDDGSIDNSYKIIKSYQTLDNRIKIFKKTNGGVSTARNYALNFISGKYVLFLDGDDVISDNLLEVAYNYFCQNNIDMFSFGYKKVDPGLKTTLKEYSNIKLAKTIYSGGEFINLFFQRKVAQCMSSFIVTREIIESNKIKFDENTKYAEDQEFQIRCMSSSSKIYYDSTIYFLYVQRDGSAINRSMTRDNYDVYLRLKNYIKDENEKSYYNYLCYVFVSNTKNIITKGSDKETVSKLLGMDFVFDRFSFSFSKYNLIVQIFKVFYGFYLKGFLKRKYKLKVN